MSHAIDQSVRRHLPNSPIIIAINLVDVALGEFCFFAGVIEGPVAIEKMDRAEDEIEPVPIFLHPFTSGVGMDGVVIQLNPGANSEIRVGIAKAVDHIEVDALMITIVISKCEIAQTDFARVIGPGLQ